MIKPASSQLRRMTPGLLVSIALALLLAGCAPLQPGARPDPAVMYESTALLTQLKRSPSVIRMSNASIPSGLWPYFQEYDPRRLDREQDADLIIQRTLEYGTWEEIRWLMAAYGRKRICEFVRLRGERQLSAVTFTYWRKLLGLRRWQHSPFGTEARQVWPF